MPRLFSLCRALSASAIVALSLLLGIAAAPARALTESQQDAAISQLQSTVSSQQTIINALMAKLKYVTVSGTDMTISGANLHVVSGSGHTNSAPNGLGNVIIGYDEMRASGNVRTGSHNLILGAGNNFSSYGGLVAGYENAVSGAYASVTGGSGNAASAGYAAVGGGQGYAASTAYAFLPASPSQASLQSFQSQITSLQTAAAAQSKVTSLFSLSTDTTRSDKKANTELTLTGVNLHLVNGLGATNGKPNSPKDTASPVVNGLGNLIVGYNELRNDPNVSADARTGSHNVIIGDQNNYTSYGGFVAGDDNALFAEFASVAGGTGNTVEGNGSSVSGGDDNAAYGVDSAVSGGKNVIEGTNYEWAAGSLQSP